MGELLTHPPLLWGRVSRIERRFEDLSWVLLKSRSISSCDKVGTPKRDKIVFLYTSWSLRGEISSKRCEFLAYFIIWVFKILNREKELKVLGERKFKKKIQE